MSDIVIKVENIWKEYHLDVVSHHSMAKDLQSWWARVQGKEDPNAPVGTGIAKSKGVSGKRSDSPHAHTPILTPSSTPPPSSPLPSSQSSPSSPDTPIRRFSLPPRKTASGRFATSPSRSSRENV